jgi:hypothetical protein
MSANVATEIRYNTPRLVVVRAAGVVLQARANEVVDHGGHRVVRPGQGGVVIAPGLGEPADDWLADHLEPGASVGDPDPSIDRALGSLSCVGNRAQVLDGPAAGAEGIVIGKHGAVLVAFGQPETALLAPGHQIAIDMHGIGLAIDGEPDIAFRSCSPIVADGLIIGRTADRRIRVPVVRVLPAEAAAAGIGMPSDRFNMDLQVDQPTTANAAAGLRFGDVVAVIDQDHAYGRRYHPGWVAIGMVCHGSSIPGGHGLGMVTLLTGPLSRIDVFENPGSRLGSFVALSR